MGESSGTHRGQGGVTLVEILVAMLIGLLVVGAAVFMFNFATGQERRSTGSISASNSAFRTGTRFADDVASVSSVAGVSDPVAVGVPGCGGSTAEVRLAGTDSSGQVQVRSYHRVVDDGRVKLLTLAEVPQGCSSIFPTWVGLDSRRVLLSG